MPQVVLEDREGSHEKPIVGMQLGRSHVDLGE